MENGVHDGSCERRVIASRVAHDFVFVLGPRDVVVGGRRCNHSKLGEKLAVCLVKDPTCYK